MGTQELWSQDRARLLAAAAELGARDRSVARVADLLLARALADCIGVLGQSLAGASLEELLGEVALFPLPSLAEGAPQRKAAVNAAMTCAAHMEDPALFHHWSESSQSTDPGRKGRGAFSTPPELGSVMATTAVDGLTPSSGDLPKTLDPSAGHGALLLAVLEALIDRGASARSAVASLHGVELDPHARELCCLALWLRVSRPDVSLSEIASRVVLGNALTAKWLAEEGPASLFESEPPLSLNSELAWEATFRAVFAEGGFDLVIANPPWESLRHFHSADPEDWLQREATRARLATEVDTGRGLPLLYSAQGRGDRNLYKGFVELFPHLLSQGGRLVALLPGAFSSDLGMQPARELYLDQMDLLQWTSFENLAGYFPIDGRYKFGILIAARSTAGTSSIRVRFMARDAEEASAADGHIELARTHLAKLGGPSKMFPEVTDQDELAILELASDHGTHFFDQDGSFGPISYRREVDLTLDRKVGHFVHLQHARRQGFRPLADGTWSDGSRIFVPLIEGRMVASWDFFQKSWVSGRGRSAVWRENDGASLSNCQPQFLAPQPVTNECRLAICDVTSATNTRTMLASWVPAWPCGNTAPVLTAGEHPKTLALLAVLNSMTFDWLLRRIAAGLHLNRFYLEAMPLPRLSRADLAKLSAFAAASVMDGDRCGDLPRSEVAELRELASAEALPSAGEIEAIVARCYGLGAQHVRRIMSSSSADRKGLWRFFEANPGAVEIAKESISLLAAA